MDTIVGTTAGASPKTVEMDILESGLAQDAEGELYHIVKSGEATFFHRLEAEAEKLVGEGIEKLEEVVNEEIAKLGTPTEDEGDTGDEQPATDEGETNSNGTATAE
jgi:hypothetical protein